MSERYTRLYALPGDLYAAGAPLLIAAGAITKDNQTGNVLAQLKLCNLQERPIKAVTVFLTPFDTMGQPLGEGFSHQYLDLNAARDAFCAQQTPIPLPDAATRSFAVCVTEVIFADNSVWKATDTTAWQPLPAAETLDATLSDREMVKQYRIRYGNNCRFLFQRVHDLWRCPCGAWNKETESVCHVCKKEAAPLDAFQIDDLRAECDARLAQERQKAAEQKAAVAAQTKKLLHIAKFAVPIALVLIVAIGLGARYMALQAEHQEDYAEAVEDLADGDYLDALYGFEDLGNYKDSPDQAKEALYQLAIETAVSGDLSGRVSKAVRDQRKRDSERGNDQITAAAAGDDSAAPSESETIGGAAGEAIAMFEELGDYRDSAALKEEVKRQAEALKKLEPIFAPATARNRLHAIDIAAAAEIVGDSEPPILIDEYEDYYEAVTAYLPYYGTFELVSGDAAMIADVAKSGVSPDNRYILRHYLGTSKWDYYLTMTPAQSDQGGTIFTTEYPEADFSVRLSSYRMKLSVTSQGTVQLGKYTRYGNSPLAQCELKKVSNDTTVTAPAAPAEGNTDTQQGTA